MVGECQGKVWMLSSPSVVAQQWQEKNRTDVTLGSYPAAVRWQNSPDLRGRSKGKYKEQVNSYSETSPPFKIKYFVIYRNFVLFYCIFTFLHCNFIPVNITVIAELTPGQ